MVARVLRRVRNILLRRAEERQERGMGPSLQSQRGSEGCSGNQGASVGVHYVERIALLALAMTNRGMASPFVPAHGGVVMLRAVRLAKQLFSGLLLGSVAGLAVGCRAEAERRLSEEAQVLSALVQGLRAAENDRKAPALEALKKFQCQGPRTCEVQTVCVAGYAQHQEAIAAAALLRRDLASGEALNEENAKGVLAFSEQNLALAKQKIDQCVQLETALLVETRP